MDEAVLAMKTLGKDTDTDYYIYERFIESKL